jgi:hypothetical protein
MAIDGKDLSLTAESPADALTLLVIDMHLIVAGKALRMISI